MVAADVRRLTPPWHGQPAPLHPGCHDKGMMTSIARSPTWRLTSHYIRARIGTALLLLMLTVATIPASQAAESLADALQKGLVEEEVNRDLEAATRAYRTVATLYDAQRATAATAIFRLGEALRKQGKTGEANIQYQRIVAEFGDQTALVKLSRQFLGEKSSPPVESSSDDVTTRRLEQDLAAVEAEASQANAQLSDLKKLSSADLRKVIPATVNDPRLTDLLIKLNEAEQRLAAASFDLGKENPEVKRSVVTIATIEKQLEATIEGILLGLETRAKATAARVEILHKRLAEARKTMPGANTRQDIVPPDTASTRQAAEEERERQEIQTVRELLDNSPDLVDQLDQYGFSRLHTAVRLGRLRLAEFLITRHASLELQHQNNSEVNLMGQKELTHRSRALHLAAVTTNLAMARLLLDQGAEVDSQDGRGSTSLKLAARAGRGDMVKLLCDRGAKVNYQGGPSGGSALHDATELGFRAVAEVLISKGATIDLASPVQPNEPGAIIGRRTPLHIAASKGYQVMITMLLAGGANVNATDQLDETPLYLATTGDVNVVALLLQKGADPKIGAQSREQELKGITPLHAAAERGFPEVIQQLLQHGADVNQTNSLGQTPLWTAVAALRNTSTTRPIQQQVCELLLGRGASPNVSARYALAKDARQDRPPWPFGSRRGDGRSPMLLGTLWDAPGDPIMRLLLEHGADVNARDDEGWGPLHAAALNRTPEIARLLVQKRADVNLQNGDGNTPLHLAVARANSPMVEFLLAHGADPNARNQGGFTALDILNGKPIYGETRSSMDVAQWLNIAPAEIAARRPKIEALLKEKIGSPGKAE